MLTETQIKDLIHSIDTMDAEKFASFISEDGTFRWGSNPEVEGREAITGFVAEFFKMFKGLSHELLNTWTVEENGSSFMFMRGMVSYKLQSDTVITIPFFNHFTMNGSKVQDYHVYGDPTPVFAAMQG
ncbi:nuclear transport factor 2 family protein [bacterium]|nr:nuclear transport factor 2 family protein [bacterium]